jgi:hypothetical protein
MGVCVLCQGEMQEGVSCLADPIVVGGQICQPIPFGAERRYGIPERVLAAVTHCGDCGVSKGGVHHHGCDVEECPLCHGQYLSCDCDDQFDHPTTRHHERCTVGPRPPTFTMTPGRFVPGQRRPGR